MVATLRTRGAIRPTLAVTIAPLNVGSNSRSQTAKRTASLDLVELHNFQTPAMPSSTRATDQPTGRGTASRLSLLRMGDITNKARTRLQARLCHLTFHRRMTPLRSRRSNLAGQSSRLQRLVVCLHPSSPRRAREDLACLHLFDPTRVRNEKVSSNASARVDGWRWLSLSLSLSLRPGLFYCSLTGFAGPPIVG